MKTLLSLTAAVVLLTGCALWKANPETITNRIKAVTFIGTVEVIRAHPNWKPAFVTAASELKIVETTDTLDLITVVAVLQKLPVKELRGDRAALYFTAATLLLDDQALKVKNKDETKLIARALREGIELGTK